MHNSYKANLSFTRIYSTAGFLNKVRLTLLTFGISKKNSNQHFSSHLHLIYTKTTIYRGLWVFGWFIWMVYGLHINKMDDDWGYPYDSGNLHLLG